MITITVIAADIYPRLDKTASCRSPKYLPSDAAPEATSHAYRALRLYGRAGVLDLLAKAQRIGHYMGLALADQDPAPIVAASGYLMALGFGPPSRDEFMVGCLRALQQRRSQSPWLGQTLDSGRDLVSLDLAKRTTRVDAGFMRHTPDSSPAEVHVRVALVLLAPSHPLAVQFAIIGLPAQGRTSGTAPVLGLLTCLAPLVCNPDLGPCRAREVASSTFGLSVAIQG